MPLGFSLRRLEFASMTIEFSTPKIPLSTEPTAFVERFPWYGIRTRPNHERVAALLLIGKGYESYLPVYHLHRRRTGVTVESYRPLFPGYLFCRFDAKNRLPILMTSGVISVLGFGNEPAAIPDEEIEAVSAALRSGLRAEPCAYLREGQRVRVTKARWVVWRVYSSNRRARYVWLSR